MKHSYHAHHAPMGACGSYLLGLNGAGGGFVEGAAGEGTQDVFVGYRYAGEPWTLLPFVREATVRATGGSISLLPHGRYGRTLGWATDRWMAQALVLLLATPFDSIADPAGLDPARRRLLLTSAVYGLLDFDNSHMDVPVELVCAVADPVNPWRVLGEAGSGYDDATRLAAVVAKGDEGGVGLGAAASAGVNAFCGADVLGVAAAGLVFRIPPAGKAVIPIVFGFGSDLAATMATALGQFPEARAMAQRRDDELRASGLAEDARRQISLATRACLAAESVASGIDLTLGAMMPRAQA